MGIRLGIGSYTFGWAVGAGQLSATQIIDIASEHGLGVVQVCENLPAETFDDDRLDELRGYAEARRVELELGTSGCRPERLRAKISIARRLGARILRSVLDSPGDEPSPADAVARIREVLGHLRESGVTLAVENHDRFPSAALAWLIEQCADDHVGICLDTCNSMGVPEGVRQVVQTLAAHTVNVHLKDFVVRRVASMQGFTVEGRPAGEGILDVPWLVKELEACPRGRTGTLSVIIETWSSPLSCQRETIERERQWAMRGILNLSKIGLK